MLAIRHQISLPVDAAASPCWSKPIFTSSLSSDAVQQCPIGQQTLRDGNGQVWVVALVHCCIATAYSFAFGSSSLEVHAAGACAAREVDPLRQLLLGIASADPEIIHYQEQWLTFKQLRVLCTSRLPQNLTSAKEKIECVLLPSCDPTLLGLHLCCHASAARIQSQNSQTIFVVLLRAFRFSNKCISCLDAVCTCILMRLHAQVEYSHAGTAAARQGAQPAAGRCVSCASGTLPYGCIKVLAGSTELLCGKPGHKKGRKIQCSRGRL